MRYDKLYMGHDVFFFNDRSGKVERLHANLVSLLLMKRWPIFV